MNNQVFALWVLVIAMGVSHFYSSVRQHFSGKQELIVMNQQLQKELEYQKLIAALTRQEMQEIKQDVATLIPPADPKTPYPVRSLASVFVAPDPDHLKLERAGTLFAHAKENFRNKNFEESNEMFRKLIKHRPDSIHIPESYFLLVEGLYQTREFEECIEWIDKMLVLFPEDELVGFALLRLGQLFTFQDRFEDAVDVYKTVIHTYSKNDVLVKQAKIFLNEISL